MVICRLQLQVQLTVLSSNTQAGQAGALSLSTLTYLNSSQPNVRVRSLLTVQQKEHGALLLWRIWHMLPRDEISLDKHLRRSLQRTLPLPLDHGHLSPPDHLLPWTQVRHPDDHAILVFIFIFSGKPVEDY